MASVTQDAASLRYVPANATEWDTLLTGTGLASPSSLWLCQEASGTLADSIGSRTITVNGTPTYRATATGWSRVGIKPADGSATDYGTCTISDVNTTSGLLLQMFSLNTAAAGSRGFNHIGSASASKASIESGNKLRATSDANTDDGEVAQAGTLVVVTKLDRSRSELAVYTQGEKLAPTYSAPSASTTMYVFGDASAALDATLVYAAYWSGSDAEMSDAQVQALLDTLEGNMTTRQKFAAGSTSYKTVVAIEGFEYLISDAPSAAVLDAWHGYDWTQVLGGLYVNVSGAQSIDRDAPFTTMGRTTIRVLDETGDDVLGKAAHRRLAGGETPITSTVDRNDTTINVASTTNFPSSGTAYIGTECLTYSGTTATTLTGCVRGKYSPFGVSTSGSGGLRFGGHHRVGFDINSVQMQPLVTTLPRVWIGKRIGIWVHSWDEENQKLNHKREAELVYAGRITLIGDDAHTGCIVIESDHISKDLQNATLGRDQWKATLADGLYLAEGRVFKFTEFLSGSASGAANDLTVVASGASGTNQMNAGYYMGNEITAVMSAWLAGEKDAGRIAGFYNFNTPVSSSVGPRTKCYWRREGTSNVFVYWHLEMPGEVSAFLGIGEEEPGTTAQSALWGAKPALSNRDEVTQGKKSPFHTLIFKPHGPGRLAQEFTEAIAYEAENESGTFIDQLSVLPWAIRAHCDSTKPWGVFLFDEKTLVVGSLTDGVLSNCWLAPMQLTADNESDALVYVGRRVDEPERGPVTLRQFLIIEGPWAHLVKTLFYSTGTSGYNHGTYDTLGHAISTGTPGELFGPEFERSLDSMPGAQVPVVAVIDEPTKVIDLLGADFLLRRSFVRFVNGHFEIKQWRTPTAAHAVVALEEANKAAPSTDDKHEFRCSSVLSSEYARPAIKFDYSREFAVDRSGNYQRSFGIEDRTQVDDLGGAVQLQTIKLRNTFAGSLGVGAGLDSLLQDYVPAMPMFRPSLAIERSLDQRYFFELGPGDIVTVSDEFARDPVTGERGISERPGMTVSASFTLGGFTSSGKEIQSGRVEVNFLDVQRGRSFAPSAMVDYSESSGDFDAGYDSNTNTLRCFEHAYSNDSSSVVTIRGRRVGGEEDTDPSYFDAGDEILIVEIDPSDPTSPTYWERTVLSQSGADIVLTSALSSPAWDGTKKYRIAPRKWSEVADSQQDWAYQADDADHMIEDDEPPFHYAASEDTTAFADNTGIEQGEYIPQISYGDGRPYDVGHERALVNTVNAYLDYKSAYQSPFLWNTIATASASGFDSDPNVLFAGPIFLGMDLLSGRITRTLTVAPFFRSSNGSDAGVRVTLSRTKPQPGVAQDNFLSWVGAFQESAFKDAYSQTAYWTTTSTTWQTGADKTLVVDVKDVATGIVWLVIEGTGRIQCRGLAKCIEGIRRIET